MEERSVAAPISDKNKPAPDFYCTREIFRFPERCQDNFDSGVPLKSSDCEQRTEINIDNNQAH